MLLNAANPAVFLPVSLPQPDLMFSLYLQLNQVQSLQCQVSFLLEKERKCEYESETGGGLSVGWQKGTKPPNTVDKLRGRGRDRRHLDLNQVKDREKKRQK